MNTKQLVVEAMKDLPDNALIEDAMERILLLSKIDRGTRQANEGQTVTHDEIKQKFSKWLR